MRGAIASLATGTYTVTRVSAGTYTQGRHTPGAPTAFVIVASIQPATGRELRDLPEGQRGDEVIAIYTTTEIRTREPGGEPDVITYGGEPWTVIRVKRWESFGAVHFEALAARAPSPSGVVP